MHRRYSIKLIPKYKKISPLGTFFFLQKKSAHVEYAEASSAAGKNEKKTREEPLTRRLITIAEGGTCATRGARGWLAEHRWDERGIKAKERGPGRTRRKRRRKERREDRSVEFAYKQVWDFIRIARVCLHHYKHFVATPSIALAEGTYPMGGGGGGGGELHSDASFEKRESRRATSNVPDSNLRALSRCRFRLN